MNGLHIATGMEAEVFRRQMKDITHIAAQVGLFLLLAVTPGLKSVTAAPAGQPAGPKLKAETQAAFDRYVRLAEARHEAGLKDGTKFLWADGLPEEQRTEAYAALKRGEIKMRRLEILDNGKPIPCPGGMIHHWTGVVFLAGAKLEDVLAVLEDYDYHALYYAPDVERSRIESREGNHFRVFLRFRRHKIITVVLNTEHDV